MPAFNYTALNKIGQTKKGVIEADSSRHARQLLREQQLSPLEINEVGVDKIASQELGRRRASGGKRIKIKDLSLITRQMATLLSAGLPVEEVLQGVVEQTEKAGAKSIMAGVRSRVNEGHSLADAMRFFPNAFPELYCATVGAGEQTGRLDLILNRLADYTEKQQAIRQKIQQALIYPSLMILVSISIVTFLLVFVVPKIIDVFKSSGQALPEITKVLIGISSFVQSYGIYLLLFIIAMLFIFRRLLRREYFRERWHQFLLKLPIIGYMIKTINTARYARTFGILFAASVSVLEAMRVSASLITNVPMHKKIRDAANLVREGAQINLALKQTGYFAPMSLQLIATGEATGRLEEMLERAANNQEQEVSRIIETSLTLFEPLIILIMGVIVLFIVLAILLPIFALQQITT